MPGILFDIPSSAPDVAREAIAAMRELVEQERERSESLDGRASQAEQAAAMWQACARTLAAEVEERRALPVHEEPEPERRVPWWRFWRHQV